MVTTFWSKAQVREWEDELIYWYYWAADHGCWFVMGKIGKC